MPETTGQQMQVPSNGSGGRKEKRRKKVPKIADNRWQKESAQQRSHTISNMTSSKKGKGKGKGTRDRPSSP